MRKSMFVLGLGALLMASSCAEPPPEGPPFRLVGSTEDVMHGIVIPNAALIWESVGTVVDENGITDFQPETDEEWEEVADRAIGLAEAANLLLFPERSEGREGWIETALMMSDRAVRVSETALLRDRDALLESGGELYEACVACHEEYVADETGIGGL